MTRANLIIALLGVITLFIVINMVRTRRLQERYALLWLLAGVGLTIAPLFIPLLDRLANALGFAYTPALLLMLAVVGLLLLIFQLSLSLTRSGEQIKVLTQELGLLRREVELLAQKTAAGPAAAPRAGEAGPGPTPLPPPSLAGRAFAEAVSDEKRVENDGQPA